MINRYTNSIAGRVTPEIRNKIQRTIGTFAKDHQLPFNTVSGAVMFAAERLSGRVTRERVEALITAETVKSYESELQRRTTARRLQITGMIRRALPVAQRTAEVVDRLYGQFASFKGSIPTLQQTIQAEVSAMNAVVLL